MLICAIAARFDEQEEQREFLFGFALRCGGDQGLMENGGAGGSEFIGREKTREGENSAARRGM